MQSGYSNRFRAVLIGLPVAGLWQSGQQLKIESGERIQLSPQTLKGGGGLPTCQGA